MRGETPERCLLVGVDLRSGATGAEAAFEYTAEESLQELAELAEGAGAEVLGATTQTREKADAATLVGSGKVDELKAWAAETGADFVLFDQPLSPSQQRNLERLFDCRVLDRTQLILDIFARHARTREGKLQVELAQLSYLLPRLTGRGAAMSRLGGGIGTRGPGETKLETDRRRIGRRIDKLEADLEKVRATRELQRKKRTAVPLSTVALAGYTNAGKSTLFNALTDSVVLADKKMFATLDPTIRVLELPSRRRVLLSDTVGFIRNLPTTLVKAFRATLEEVVEASLILHVVDAASPHRREQMREVDRLLTELGAHEKPQILVLNKADLLGPEAAEAVLEAERTAGGRAAVAAISAREQSGLDELKRLIEQCVPADPLAVCRFRFPHDRGDLLSFLYQNARVMEREDGADAVEVVAEATESVRRRLEAYTETPA
ncbi:MAG: GTPase HflX [Acidobacteria bacterium]|nr:GTPase HflX [Acidobacteriota bacterium]